ncbi:MAG: LysM peptidoglycan-binding domain-containing protein, partial [Pseudomonadales bacterium]
GFISNPGEAAKLRTPSYQKKMAKAIAAGIKEYYYANPVANTYIATLVAAKGQQITYKVVRGDTLSEIAQRYNTSISKLRTANKLNAKSVLQIGQLLVIPTG